MAKATTTQGPAPKNSGMLTLIILGGVALGGVLLCGCGFAFWIGWLVSLNVTPEKWDERVKQQADERWKHEERQATSDQQRAKAFLEYWLQLLHMKNLDEPYCLTTKKLQGTMSRQQFADFIAANPKIKQQDHNWSHGNDAKPGTRFGFMMHTRPQNFWLWVEKEGNEWKVDALEKQN